IVTAWISYDGSTWSTLMTKDFGTALNALPQRLSITGGSWFSSAGSYADWDYVSLRPTGTAPSIACPASIAVNDDHGACGAQVGFQVAASGTPAPTVTCSVASPYFFPVGT